MRYIRSFLAFWWNFIVGDDWRLAAGTAGALVLSSVVAHHGWAAWLVLPVSIAVLLADSLRRASTNLPDPDGAPAD